MILTLTHTHLTAKGPRRSILGTLVFFFDSNISTVSQFLPNFKKVGVLQMLQWLPNFHDHSLALQRDGVAKRAPALKLRSSSSSVNHPGAKPNIHRPMAVFEATAAAHDCTCCMCMLKKKYLCAAEERFHI